MDIFLIISGLPMIFHNSSMVKLTIFDTFYILIRSGKSGVWGLGFGVWGLGFGVWGLRFEVLEVLFNQLYNASFFHSLNFYEIIF